jgi:hypothetical protein
MRRPQRAHDAAQTVEFEPQDLTGFFAAPRWLQDLGTSAWLAVGVTLAVVGAVWILSLTQTIVAPVITAAVVAAVTSPLVAWLERRGLARGLGAALVLVGVIVLAAAVVVIVVGAWGAGTFAVLIALGGAGTDAAIGMIVLQLLANGIL